MYNELCISAIAAVADNGVIGRAGTLPWRLPADLARFKRLTQGHALIMGLGTWRGLRRPLPRRLNIVLSGSLHATDPNPTHPRLCVVDTLNRALEEAARWETEQLAKGRIARPEIFAIGGPKIWSALWPQVDRLYQTRVHEQTLGDRRFPSVDLSPFFRVERREIDDALPTTFEIWQRESCELPIIIAT